MERNTISENEEQLLIGYETRGFLIRFPGIRYLKPTEIVRRGKNIQITRYGKVLRDNVNEQWNLDGSEVRSVYVNSHFSVPYLIWALIFLGMAILLFAVPKEYIDSVSNYGQLGGIVALLLVFYWLWLAHNSVFVIKTSNNSSIKIYSFEKNESLEALKDILDKANKESEKYSGMAGYSSGFNAAAGAAASSAFNASNSAFTSGFAPQAAFGAATSDMFCNACCEVFGSSGGIDRHKNYKRAATFVILYRILSVLSIAVVLVIPFVFNVYVISEVFGIDTGVKEPQIEAAAPVTSKPAKVADEKKAEEPVVKKRTGPIKVGVINSDPNESGYRTANCKDIENMINTEGYEAVYGYSLRNDIQIKNAEKFIQDGVDYLLIAAAESSGWEPVLRKAKEKDIRVILYDKMVDVDESLYDAYIMSDMEKEGETAVEWLKKNVTGRCNIVHIQGAAGSETQRGRTKALEEAASSEGWNIVEQRSAEWRLDKAQQIVQDVISEGTYFNVIYAETDDMAKGAVAALDWAGISHGARGDVIVISFDSNSWAMESVRSGEWNCDIQCNPFQGYYVKEVINILEAGKKLKNKRICVEDKLFDSDNITDNDIRLYGI